MPVTIIENDKDLEKCLPKWYVKLNRVRALVCKDKVLKITGQTAETDKIVSAIEK